MRIKPLIGYLGINTTQENIDQLYDYLKYILPPVDEPVHTLDMQYRCMNIRSNRIITLNSGQITIDTAD